MDKDKGSSRKRYRLASDISESESKKEIEITTITVTDTFNSQILSITCPKINQDNITIITADTSNSQISTITHPKSNRNNVLRTKVKPQQFSKVWDYFIKGVERSNGYYEAKCNYYEKNWARGKPVKLEAHLANEYASSPDDISRYWQDKVAKRDPNYHRMSKKSVLPTSASQIIIISHYISDRPLSNTTIN
ncbi:12428_t:CDS:1 [Ambispora leptoticha]|uniref:12428_t:CDS:1 n=1 Tax=Ambispora leptoticha TaxID=144679 RepID=A0A9N9GC68_9GLOM|nr:12428_t:CDS:1 [Ambispora leptoticha]